MRRIIAVVVCVWGFGGMLWCFTTVVLLTSLLSIRNLSTGEKNSSDLDLFSVPGVDHVFTFKRSVSVLLICGKRLSILTSVSLTSPL